MRDNHPFDRWVSLETRRQFFGKTAKGLGSAALASLLCRRGAAALATGDAFLELGQSHCCIGEFDQIMRRAQMPLFSKAMWVLELRVVHLLLYGHSVHLSDKATQRSDFLLDIS